MSVPQGWPKCTLEEAEAKLTAADSLFETRSEVVEGQVYRVYTKLPISLRDLWIKTREHGDKLYLMYANERITYRQAHEQAEGIARKLYHEHGIRHGDRIGIVARNLPEWITMWWASQMLGAILCGVNAWLPAEPMVFCLTNTNCKVIMVDEERLRLLDAHYQTLAERGMQLLLVARPKSSHPTAIDFGHWADHKCAKPLPEIEIKPDDRCAIYFTSGTTGLPKGVLQTHRQFLTNFFNTQVAGVRAWYRKGLTPPTPTASTPQAGLLLGTPMFHVTANHSLLTQVTAFGGKIALMHKWNVEEAVRLIRTEKLTIAGGVPSMVAQLVESDLKSGNNTLTNFLFGGAPSSKNLIKDATTAFPTISLSQAYGLTETNSVAVSMAGEDYLVRPAACGKATPVNEVKIMDPEKNVEMPLGQPGEIWIRGVNVAVGYWNNPKATAEAFTKDHWFKSGDVGYMDKDGFLYISDRMKDVIIRGGENIASSMVENAIYSDTRIMDCAVIGVPDEKLGELVAAIVAPKPAYRGQLKEDEVIAVAKKNLPYYAYPVMVVILDDPIPRNANGKVVKRELKPMLLEAWAKKQASTVKAKL